MRSYWCADPLTGGQVTNRLAEFAAGEWGVVTYAELLSLGLSAKQIEVLVRQGHLHPLHRGVYAVGHRNITQEGRWLAAVKACNFSVLSHYSAACLYCWLKWDGRPIEITAPGKHSRPTIKAHRSERIERTVYRRIPVTPRVRTIIDLARTEDEATVTRALRQARFSEAELALLPTTGMLGRIVNLPTRSDPEDVVLNLVLTAGLKPPLVNAPYRLPTRIVYPDLYWPEQRLVVEVDSAEWHSDPLAQRDDAERQSLLEAAGERVIRITRAQARAQPQRTLARLRAAGL